MSAASDTPLLGLRGAGKRFGSTQALVGIDFDAVPGRAVGVVGGSGSGKSTLANILLGLERPDSGSVLYRGGDLRRLPRAAQRRFRADVQMVFQDPFASLNPRNRIAAIVEEPLIVQRRGDAAARRMAVLAALDEAGLRPAAAFAARYPHELSGGQRQRVAIARAIVLRPAVLVADEPVSMLDVSVRNGVLRLFRRFADQGMAIVFITHDLSLLGALCAEAVVMHRGAIVERGTPAELLQAPRHEYTQRLVAAVPRLAPHAAP